MEHSVGMSVKQQYVAAVSNADVDDLRTALAAVSGDWAAYLFREAVIRDDDPDDLDPPRGWAVVTPRTWQQRELELFKQTVQAVNPGSLQYRQVPAKLFDEDLAEDQTLDAWFATNGFRRRGVVMVSVGHASADGTEDAQDTTTSYILVNQWTTLDRMVQMSRSGQRFELNLGGTYRLSVSLEFEAVQGTLFGFRAVRNAGVVGDELVSGDGEAVGSIEGTLSAGDLIGLAVRSSQAASFKLLAGSEIRLKRIAS